MLEAQSYSTLTFASSRCCTVSLERPGAGTGRCASGSREVAVTREGVVRTAEHQMARMSSSWMGFDLLLIVRLSLVATCSLILLPAGRQRECCFTGDVSCRAVVRARRFVCRRLPFFVALQRTTFRVAAHAHWRRAGKSSHRGSDKSGNNSVALQSLHWFTPRRC